VIGRNDHELGIEQVGILRGARQIDIRLITAAPELLDILEIIRLSPQAGTIGQSWFQLDNEIMKQVRIVIAKATK